MDAFFEQRRQNKLRVLDALPTYDPEEYASRYTGRTQTERLIKIGVECPQLSVEALKLAIKLLKKTPDTKRYKEIVSTLQRIAEDEPEAVLDEEWVEKTSLRVQADIEKTEAQLKSYKHNLIKESIRMGHEELGNTYFSAGNLTESYKSFTRMRDYCSTTKNLLDMFMRLIVVCIEQQNWMAVHSSIMKIRNLQRPPQEDEVLRPKLAAALGIYYLGIGEYRRAAESFLDTSATLGSTFSEVLSANDVAIYGGLCALASMERADLKSVVLDNNEFRNFLELEPQMRKAISYFYSSKYSECLKILEDYKTDYLLDIHLGNHVAKIYESIRRKGIVQYFVPFSRVTLQAMSKAFVTEEEQLEKELVSMITSGLLDARIDTMNGLLIAKERDARADVHQNTLEIARKYERSARQQLVRLNMIRAGLEVRTSNKPASQKKDFGLSQLGRGLHGVFSGLG